MIKKTTMVVIFNLQFTDRKNLSGIRPKSASEKSSSCRFSFSAERNANTKATEYVTFGFSFGILVFFPFYKQLVLRIVKALPFTHQPHRVAAKASDVSLADWPYQHTWKNTIFFHVFCYCFSQGRKSRYNTAVYVIYTFCLHDSQYKLFVGASSKH